jgi:XTP/dITP diphosphohydrolase
MGEKISNEIMKQIIFVTSNKGKYLSSKKFLKKFGIKVIQKTVDISELRGDLEKIAIHKARDAYKIVKKPLIVMDAGFFVGSLNGFPMMFTNFVLETIGLEGILRLTEGKDRNCEFREVLAYIESSRKKPKVFTRIVKGTLSKNIAGDLKTYHWSKLALVFIPDKEKKTMAEMTEKEFSIFRKRVDKHSHWEQFGEYYSKK